jgi:hypothetical protein
MKFCLPQVNGWNWRISSYVKLTRFRNSKSTCFLSYVEYRPNANKQYYICIKIYTEPIPKVGLVEETKGGGKKGKKDSEK